MLLDVIGVVLEIWCLLSKDIKMTISSYLIELRARLAIRIGQSGIRELRVSREIIDVLIN